MTTRQSYGLTDVGRRREANEDAFLEDDTRGVFAVADGMGGHAAGEVASRIAIDTLSDAFGDADDSPRSMDPDRAREALRVAILEANRRICDSVHSREEWRGMGTTMVAMVESNGKAVIGYVGDSRAYLLRGDELHRLTSDHSWVNEQVKLGLLKDEDAQRHPMRNIVTRALGNRDDVEIDLVVSAVEPGDTFLLCSDGLNTMLEDETIRSTLVEHRSDARSTCEALVDQANESGGDDNTTVVIVHYPAG